jgi:hypothetical protein
VVDGSVRDAASKAARDQMSQERTEPFLNPMHIDEFVRRLGNARRLVLGETQRQMVEYCQG